MKYQNILLVTTMQILAAFILLVAFVEGALADCACPFGCACSTKEVTCRGLNKMPDCFPDGIAYLTISASPDYNKLYENDIPKDARATLERITFSVVGFKSIDSDAFKDMPKLTDLKIVGCDRLDRLDFDSNSAPKNLRTLSVTGCTDLDTITDIKFLPNLEKANFTNCDIRKIYDSTFKGLSKLRTLLLNANPRLYYISRHALKDLYDLEVLRFDLTRMDTLYPDYFENPFNRGNLKQVITAGSYYNCKNLCSMTNWLDDNPSFNDISELGPCVLSGKSYPIKNLEEDQVCGLSVGGIIGIAIASVVLAGMIVMSVIFCIRSRAKRNY